MQKTVTTFTAITIILSVFSILFDNQVFAQIQDITFYGKGKVDQSSPFAGEIVRTIITGDTGLIMHSTPDGLVIVRLAITESAACILTVSTICLESIVTDVINTDTHNVNDRINLTIDLQNKKEFVSVVSGPLQGSNITIDLTKTRTRDNGQFSLIFSQDGGITGIQKIVKIDSSNKTMIIDDGFNPAKSFTLSDVSIMKIKEVISKSNFFDLTPKEYPPITGSADYFTYIFDINTIHFSNSIHWTDTSENIPEAVSKKIHLLQDGFESIIMSVQDEGSFEILPVNVVREFILSSTTFAFDGMEETLQINLNATMKSFPSQYVIHATFDSRHGGYGDRTGQIVTQAITPHLMVVTVVNGEVISAITDGVYDEMAKTPVNKDGRKTIDYYGLVDNLQSLGVTVLEKGNITQSFFSAQGKIISINENDVQIFSYNNIEQTQLEAAFVSADGTTIGTSNVTWVSTPHFYQTGTIIVLYVGDDSGILTLLDKIVGPQFAGG